jgi:hypothetical protein
MLSAAVRTPSFLAFACTSSTMLAKNNLQQAPMSFVRLGSLERKHPAVPCVVQELFVFLEDWHDRPSSSLAIDVVIDIDIEGSHQLRHSQ